MSSRKNNSVKKPIESHPYIVSALLFGFGLWCFWDGWIAAASGYQLFNRIASVLLIGWALVDFYIWRKRLIKFMSEKSE